MRYVSLAVEDVASEVILTRILGEYASAISIARVLGLRGNGYLRSRLRNLIQASQSGQSIIMLTDLDQAGSVESLVSDWFTGVTFSSPDFLFHVAVREIEAWLLADPTAVESLLGHRRALPPMPPDDIGDPKQWLLLQARRSARTRRELLVNEDAGRLSIGVGYNALVSNVVREHWKPSIARANSPSLELFMSKLDAW